MINLNFYASGPKPADHERRSHQRFSITFKNDDLVHSSFKNGAGTYSAAAVLFPETADGMTIDLDKPLPQPGNLIKVSAHSSKTHSKREKLGLSFCHFPWKSMACKLSIGEG